MKLYAGTTELSRADTQLNRLAEKLRGECTIQIGHRPAPPEVASWQNSLMAFRCSSTRPSSTTTASSVYQLDNTSRRLDTMLTGHSATSAEHAVVVELSSTDDCVEGPEARAGSRPATAPACR